MFHDDDEKFFRLTPRNLNCYDLFDSKKNAKFGRAGAR